MKNAKKKKKMKPISIIMAVICSLVAVYFVYSFVSVQIEINNKKNELSELQTKYENQSEENSEIESAVSGSDKNALAEQYARKKGYVMPDERVYMDVTPGSEE